MADRTLYEGIDARRPPRHIEDAILVAGGRNPLDEPMYRLVWTLGRKMESGGEWRDWAKGLSVKDRNPIRNRPIRSVVEVRTIPLYPDCPGKWMLERWLPAEGWGDPDTWYLPQSDGGTMRTAQGITVPSIGDFPSRGDYVSLGLQFTNTNLSEAKVIEFINLFEQVKLSLPTDDARRRILAMREAEQEEEEATAKRIRFNEEMMAAQDDPLAAWSLKGRAATCRLVEKLGIGQHPF